MARSALLAIVTTILAGCTSNPRAMFEEQAGEIARRALIIDGHIDLPYRMTKFEEDVAGVTIGGDFDYPRAIAGGLNAPFMSIYIPSDRQEIPGAAKALADSLIDMVEEMARRAPDKFAIARSAREVRRHQQLGLVSLPMGMENGAPIETLDDVRHFHERGIRYVTLTHARDNHICDASYDSTRTWGGLSPFGEEVVDSMNRMGIIVDVSHLTDSTIYQVLRRSRAPVLATHSSARHFTPGWERNMSDDLIQELADRDGVIMISFGSTFLRGAYQEASRSLGDRIDALLAGIDPGTREGALAREEMRKANPIGTLEDVADHIDHVVALVGIDHVGLGSDYDGVTALPAGLQDVSTYPDLIAELLLRGYKEEDIEKILGGNALRVWEDVERVARELQRSG